MTTLEIVRLWVTVRNQYPDDVTIEDRGRGD